MIVTQDTYEEVKEYIKSFKAHDLIEIECAYCNKLVLKDKGKIKTAIKNNKSLYCTLRCFSEFRKIDVNVQCLNCENWFVRKPCALGKNNFCTSSCAATYNNSKRIKIGKVKPLKELCECGNIKYRKSENCNNCTLTKRKVEAEIKINATTLGELKELYSGKVERAYGRINKYARRYYSPKSRNCKICGYDKYTEICHIKAISKFNDKSIIKEINSETNLVILCPNHHKELDLGLLRIEESIS